MLINSRVKRVVYGVADPAAGALGGAFDLNAVPGLLWHCEVTSGVLADEAVALIRNFFRERRRRSAE
jgi:tRNA(adenine34) deaminase